MRRAEERQALSHWKESLGILASLEPLLKEALARDDQPYDGKPKHDVVHKRVKLIADNLAKIRALSAGAMNLAESVRQPTGRQVSLPDCIACGELATPRPKRDMCERCYKSYTRSNYTDVQEFIRWRKARGKA